MDLVQNHWWWSQPDLVNRVSYRGNRLWAWDTSVSEPGSTEPSSQLSYLSFWDGKLRVSLSSGPTYSQFLYNVLSQKMAPRSSRGSDTTSLITENSLNSFRLRLFNRVLQKEQCTNIFSSFFEKHHAFGEKLKIVFPSLLHKRLNIMCVLFLYPIMITIRCWHHSFR